MMHTIKELYKINGEKFYTADYITAHNIPKATGYNEQGWSKCYGLGTDRGTKNIHTANGVKISGEELLENGIIHSCEDRDNTCTIYEIEES